MSEAVHVLTLDRPPVNALDLETILRLEARFSELAGEAPAALVLTGVGKCFCAGVDTRAFGAADADTRPEMIRAITRMVGRLYGLPFPVVAAVNGHALGGGLVLALACDYRLAADDPAIQLGLSEAKAGVPFPAGPLEALRAELSPETLRRLTLTSQSFSPADLMARGVVDELAPVETLLESAKARAASLAEQLAFAIVKRQVRAAALDRLAALAASGEDPLIEALSRRP